MATLQKDETNDNMNFISPNTAAQYNTESKIEIPNIQVERMEVQQQLLNVENV